MEHKYQQNKMKCPAAVYTPQVLTYSCSKEVPKSNYCHGITLAEGKC